MQVSSKCLVKMYEFNVGTRNCICDTAVPIRTQSFDTLVCENDELVLNAFTPGADYKWLDGTQNYSKEVFSSGIYTVEVTNGCDTEYFDFGIEVINCDCNIEAPNVFTPNGDDINDVFRLQLSEDIARFNLRIFNRTGSSVFETNNSTISWDGRLNEKN